MRWEWCIAGLASALMACSIGGPTDSEGGPVDTEETTPPEEVTPPGVTPTLTFAGIELAAWDGGDGLVASWSEATTNDSVGYALTVETVDGDAVASLETDELSAALPDLGEGEYRLRVTAIDAAAELTDDGGVALTQYVGGNRAVFRSHLEMDSAADVWGDGDLVVVAGLESGISFTVIDASDPSDPQVLAVVDGEGYVKDIKFGDDDLMFVNNENGVYAARIFDISDPADPVRLSRIKGSAHNLAYGDRHLYLTNNVSGRVSVYDVSDPSEPEYAWNYDPPSSVVHDQAWVDQKLYVAWWDGFSILDVSDPANPETLVEHFYSGPITDCHNVWPSKDHRFALTTDETSGGYLRIWSIEDLDNIEQVAEYIEDPNTIVHNVHVRGDYAFISYYMNGLVVLDISDPLHPVKVGHYDTTPNQSGNTMDGTWGVWPFGNHVAIGDSIDGAYLFDFYPIEVRANGDSYVR